MTKTLLSILCILLWLPLIAQQSRQHITGKIVTDSLSIADIHVINKNSGSATLSNKYGEFSIPVKEKDTLLFSSIEFINREIVITKETLRNLQLTIRLEIDITFLDEVTVKNHNFIGNLYVDVSSYRDSVYELTVKALDFSDIDFSKPVISDYDEIDRAKPPDATNLTNPNIPIGGDLLGFILSPIFNQVKKIGERKRVEKRELKTLETEAKKVPNRIRKEFGDSFFTKTLNIPPDQIDLFLDHCLKKGIANLYLKEQKIELIELMIQEGKVFARK